jgi:hypothetical protein
MIDDDEDDGHSRNNNASWPPKSQHDCKCRTIVSNAVCFSAHRI